MRPSASGRSAISPPSATSSATGPTRSWSSARSGRAEPSRRRREVGWPPLKPPPFGAAGVARDPGAPSAAHFLISRPNGAGTEPPLVGPGRFRQWLTLVAGRLDSTLSVAFRTGRMNGRQARENGFRRRRRLGQFLPFIVLPGTPNPDNFRRTEARRTKSAHKASAPIVRKTLAFVNGLPRAYSTAIGFPGEPVAPTIGTGAKM